jgi:hypothetical protein
MQKWEYLHMETAESSVYIIDGERMEEWTDLPLFQVLNRLGDDGWELVSIAFEQAILLPAHLIFKRPN